MENDTWNSKFIMRYADDVNSIEMYKRILPEIEWKNDTPTNFCESYLFGFRPGFWLFAEVNAPAMILRKS